MVTRGISTRIEGCLRMSFDDSHFEQRWFELVENWEDIPHRVLHWWGVVCVERGIQHLQRKGIAIVPCLLGAFEAKHAWLHGQITDEEVLTIRQSVEAYTHKTWGKGTASPCEEMWNLSTAMFHLCDCTNADKAARFSTYYTLRVLAPFPPFVTKNEQARQIQMSAQLWQRKQLLGLVRKDTQERTNAAVDRFSGALEEALF